MNAAVSFNARAADEPLISVCISSYNYADRLIRALEVLKSQKEDADFEVIISDDASSDDSVARAAQFAAENRDMRIRVFVNETNEGILANKSHLIEHACGRYILFCDSDDELAPGALEILSGAAAAAKADCVVGYVQDVDADGQVIQVQDFSRTPSKWMVSLLHGSLYRRSVIEKHCLRFTQMPEDAVFNLQFHEHSKHVVFVRKPVYRWFVNPQSEGRKKKRLEVEQITERFGANCRTFREVMERVAARGKAGKVCGTEAQEIEFELMKIYYGDLLMANLSVAPLQRMAVYRSMRTSMQAACPEYLQNPNLFTGKRCIARGYAAKIVRWCARFERLGLLAPVLRCYYLLRRFVFLDQ